MSDGGEVGATSIAVNPLPALTLILGILFALAIPALIRELRRRQMLTAARNGDAGAAWQTVQDAAIDLGIEVPASETAPHIRHAASFSSTAHPPPR